MMVLRDTRRQSLSLGGVPLPRSGPVNGDWATVTIGSKYEVTRGESVSVASKISNPDSVLTIQVMAEDPARVVLDGLIAAHELGTTVLQGSAYDGVRRVTWRSAVPLTVANVGLGAAARTLSYSFALDGVVG